MRVERRDCGKKENRNSLWIAVSHRQRVNAHSDGAIAARVMD